MRAAPLSGALLVRVVLVALLALGIALARHVSPQPPDLVEARS
jgi:hypothetical protein